MTPSVTVQINAKLFVRKKNRVEVRILGFRSVKSFYDYFLIFGNNPILFCVFPSLYRFLIGDARADSLGAQLSAEAQVEPTRFFELRAFSDFIPQSEFGFQPNSLYF